MKVGNGPHALWLCSIIITLALIVSPAVSGMGSFFGAALADSTDTSIAESGNTGSAADQGTSNDSTGSGHNVNNDNAGNEAITTVNSGDNSEEVTATGSDTGSTTSPEIGSTEGTTDSQGLPSSGGACGGGCGPDYIDYSYPEEYPQEVGSTSVEDQTTTSSSSTSNPIEATGPTIEGTVSTASPYPSGLANTTLPQEGGITEQNTPDELSSGSIQDAVTSGNPYQSSTHETSNPLSNVTTSGDSDQSASPTDNPVNQSASDESEGVEADLTNTTTSAGSRGETGISESGPVERESSSPARYTEMNGSPESLVLEEEAASLDPNAVTRPIDSESNREISYGDVSNIQNVSATASLDKSSYSVGDTVQITIQDKDGNIDSNTVNTVEITIRSDSDQTGIKVTLTETGPDTGQFAGNFQLTDSTSTSTSIKVDPSSGDKIQLLYDSSHPRALVTLNEVSSPGTAQLTETRVTSVNDGGDFSEVLVGNAVELTLADGAQLAPNEAADYCATQFAQPVTTCGGHITMKLSYANAPLNNQIPSELTIFQKVGGTWLNLKEFGDVIVDENAKTVTVVTPFGPGIFTIGASIGGGGGGGGGIGLPGAGIVLDFSAEITAGGEEPSPSLSTDATAGVTEQEQAGTGTTLEIGSQPGSVNDTEGEAGTPSLLLQSNAGSGGGAATTLDSANKDSLAKTGNVTIVVPGEGFVLLAYRGLLSEGNLTVDSVKNMSEITALDIAKRTEGDRGTIATSDNTKYGLVGTVFKIGPSDARFDETITVKIPYDSVLTGDKKTGEIRMLQYSGSDWEDVTVLPDADGHSVTGSISSLGPVVAAVKTG